MSLSPYQTKASEIIKESIKSAIFIDENARPFYEPVSENGAMEETLSVELFSNFKAQGISLAVHKFNASDLTDSKIKEYLFDARDLVLLDWKLNDQTGEEYALTLLSEIVKKPHIHFCSIYTSETNTDSIINNILSYFSGENKEYYDTLRLDLAGEEKEIIPLISTLNSISIERYESSSGSLIGRLFGTNRVLVESIKNAVNTNDAKCALIKAGIAFQNLVKSDEIQPCPEIISYNEKVFVINNTIITILNKGTDNDPESLIQNLAKQIADSKNSFTQLLGLEMQNIFKRKGAFIDSNMLEVSKETLLYHRSQLKEDSDNDIPFQELIKGVLIEQASLILGNESLSLLDSTLMDELTPDELPIPNDDEIVAMNIFYNSTNLKNDKRLNFGDVFYNEVDSSYFICITALCDAIRPSKINNRFRFAKGVKIEKSKALKLGDTAFISFLNKDEAVVWSEIDNINKDDLHKYRPVYVKPHVYNVSNPKFNTNFIFLNQVIQDANDGININTIKVKYITTIKENYTQRIANHAFAHPVRVGVDFLKKK